MTAAYPPLAVPPEAAAPRHVTQPDAALDAKPPARRVCLIVESAGGGTGRHVLDLAAGLLAAGDRVTLIYCPLRAEPGFTGRLATMSALNAYPLQMGRAPGLRDLPRLARLAGLVKRLGPFDVLHSHSSKAGLLTRLIPARGAARLHTPHAVRGMDPSLPRRAARLFDLAERLLARRCDRVIAVSAAEATHLRTAGLSPGRVVTILNGVPVPDDLAADAPQDLARHETEFNGRAIAAIAATTGTGGPHAAAMHQSNAPHVFGFVGRLVPQKGADRLIRAFAALPPCPVPPQLIVIGDGPDLPDLRRLAARLGVAHRIAWPGAAEAGPWYTRFDSLILPSRYEAMPYVLLEAEAAGLPIVATDVAGAAEVVGANGRIVANSEDPAALAAAMQDCLAPATHRQMRAEAARFRSRHGVAPMIAATRTAYAAARPLAVHTPKRSAVHLMHLDALAQHAAAEGMAITRIGLRGAARLRKGQTLFVQTTGLSNLIVLPLARSRGARITLYLHEPTPLARKLAENPPLKALIWHAVQRIECRLADRVLVSRGELVAAAARIFAPPHRLAVAPLLMARPEPASAGPRPRILYLGRPDERRWLTRFVAEAPALAARGYRPTILTGDPGGLARLLPHPPPQLEIIARRDFPESLKARLLAETLCLWNPKRGPIAQSGVTADALRHGVAILLTVNDPSYEPLLRAGIALDWDSEAARDFAGLDGLAPARVAAAAARLFDAMHGAAAFRRDWMAWLR